MKLQVSRKKIINFMTVIYISFIFFIPYVLNIDIREVNGYSSFFDKILQNINLIPFNYNYNINVDIIVKNIACKLLMFFPLGLFVKKQCSFKNAIIVFLIIAVAKEILHLVTFVGYFDINDLILYTIGFIMGWKLVIGYPDNILITQDIT